MKKGILRRLSAAGLAVVTLLGMSMATMAEDKTGAPNQGAVETTAAGMGTLVSTGNETGTITVNGMAEGDVATLYKIVNITYNPATNSKDYAWANGVQAAVQSAWTTDTTTQLTPANFKAKFESDTDFQSKAYQKILVAINSNNETEKAGEAFGTSKTKGESGNVEFKEVPFGQYIVKITGTNVYSPITATLDPEVGDKDKGDGNGNAENPDNYYIHNVVIDAKRATPSITKEIEDGDNTVAVNDDVDYKITVTAPTFDPEAKNFTFNVEDRMDDGIIGANDLKITYGTNTQLEAGTNTQLEAGTDISTADGADYKITYYKENTLKTPIEIEGKTEETIRAAIKEARGFKIEFNMHKAAVNGQKLTVKYNSKVTAEIVGKTGVENKATLIWPKNVWAVKGNSDQPDNPNDTNYNKVPSSVDVYSFGLDLTKVEKGTENAANPTKLKGAEFKLYKKGVEKAISVVETAKGIYRVATDKDADDSKTTVLVVSDDPTNLGGLKVSGLDVGEYELEETKAPTGYSLPTDRFPLNIQAETTGNAGNTTLTGKVVESTDAYLHSKIANSKGFTLPKTGDAAMFIMSIVGAGLVVFGVAFFALSRGKSRKQSRR